MSLSIRNCKTRQEWKKSRNFPEKMKKRQRTQFASRSKRKWNITLLLSPLVLFVPFRGISGYWLMLGVINFVSVWTTIDLRANDRSRGIRLRPRNCFGYYFCSAANHKLNWRAGGMFETSDIAASECERVAKLWLQLQAILTLQRQ